MRLIILLFLSLFPVFVFSQNITIDDFEAGSLSSSWLATGSCFSLSLSEQSLKVDYNRTGAGHEWDQFAYSFTSAPVLSSYRISFKIKSSLAVKISLKPVYTDNSSDWIETNVKGDNLWSNQVFAIKSASARSLQTFYIYLNGGSATVESGTVMFDNFQIEQGADKSLLERAVKNAKNLLAYSTEGTSDGQFGFGSKQTYQTAVGLAETALSETGQDEAAVLQAIGALNDATTIFEGTVVSDADVASCISTNPSASRETKLLYYNLRNYGKTKMLFGMQDATGYGVGWTGDNDRSDVKDVCGAYPSVFGWGLADIANGNNFENNFYRIAKFYELNGVNTMEWHCENPFGGNFNWSERLTDNNAVASLVYGGSKNAWFKERLDRIALFFKNLKDKNGVSIPVIFRPWHEHTGDWFWWGKTHCSKQEYIDLWRYTADYLIKIKKVNNLIFAYSPDRFGDLAGYTERYPGDAYVDILGFDDYWDLRYNESSYNPSAFLSQLKVVVNLAESKNKIPALTECGYQNLGYKNWFTEVILNPIKNDEVAKRIAYTMVWHNADKTQFYAPYPSHSSVDDFVKFYQDPFTIFLDKMPNIYHTNLYPSTPTAVTEVNTNKLSLKVFSFEGQKSVLVPTEGKTGSIQLINMMGQVIATARVDKQTETCLQAPPSAKGLYILRAEFSTGQAFSQKIEF